MLKFLDWLLSKRNKTTKIKCIDQIKEHDDIVEYTQREFLPGKSSNILGEEYKQLSKVINHALIPNNHNKFNIATPKENKTEFECFSAPSEK